MPLYPYRCIECGHRFEKIQSFSAKPLTECPECGGALERLLTAPGLKFVGAGWYANDYGLKAATGVASEAPEKKPEPKAADAKSSGPAPAAPSTSAATSTAS